MILVILGIVALALPLYFLLKYEIKKRKIETERKALIKTLRKTKVDSDEFHAGAHQE